jgi:hypothetical protein
LVSVDLLKKNHQLASFLASQKPSIFLTKKGLITKKIGVNQMSKSPKKYLVLFFGSLGVSLNFLLIMNQGLTQANPASSSSKEQAFTLREPLPRVTFEPPDEDQPSHTVGGASRDGGSLCLSDNVPEQPQNLLTDFLPLIPQNNHGLTIADRPTFYANVPETNAERVFFSLRDQDNQTLYQNEFSIPQTGGIISFSLPETAPSLEIGKNYQWSMVLMCNQTMRPDSPRITSWVKRVAPLPMTANQPQNQIGIELAAFYAKNGIWYDSLNILGNLWRKSPQNFSQYANQWANFLSQDSVGLEAIANQPLLTKPLIAETE